MNKIKLIFIMAIGAVFMTCPMAFAETGADIQNLQQQLINQQLRENEIRNIEQASPYKIKTSEPEKSNTDKARTGHCANVKQIVFVGNTILSNRKIRHITKKYENKCLYVDDINQMMNDITNKYIDRGYITSRAYIEMPQTRLNDGILDIRIIEGTINKITGLTNYEQITAFTLMQYRELNLRDIEQGLDQINRLESNHATMDITAAKDQDATSDINIKNEPIGRNEYELTFDNFGTDSTGAWRSGARYTRDNLFGLNDQLNLSLNHSISNFDERLSRSATIGYSLPFGYWTFSNTFSYSYYKTSFPMPVSSNPFYSLGNSYINTTSIDRVLTRGQRYKFSATAGLTYKNNENFMQVYDLKTKNNASSRALSVFNFDLPLTLYFPYGTIYIKPGIAQGTKLFDALNDDKSPYSGRAQYTAAKFFTYTGWNFGFVNLSSALDSQWSNDELFSTETMYLGGASSIRGFRNDGISGDSGFNLRNDLDFNLGKIFKSENVWLNRFTPGLFTDFGMTFSKEDDVSNSRIAGAGVKLGFKYWLINTTASYAHITDKQNWMTEDYNIYVSAALSTRF